MANFYFGTLEEYYFGELTLYPCNGVTDGSVAIIGLTVLMAFLGGSNLWATPIYDVSSWNIRGLTIMTIGQVFCLFVAILHWLLTFAK